MKNIYPLLFCSFFVFAGSVGANEHGSNAEMGVVQDPAQGQSQGQSPSGVLQGAVDATQVESGLNEMGVSLTRHVPGILPVTVGSVRAGSPADSGGIAANDLITKIDFDNLSAHVTLKRDGKLLRAVITNDDTKMLEPRAVDQQFDVSATGSHAILEQSKVAPLRIDVSLGGSGFKNSFNGQRTKHEMLMRLADMIADTANNLPPNSSARIGVQHAAEDCTNKYNGPSAASLIDGSRVIPQISGSPVEPSAFVDDKTGLSLFPVTIHFQVGGSDFRTSFNNGTTSSILDYGQPGRRAGEPPEPKAVARPGGPLAEIPTGNLRSTVLEYSIGGSHQSDRTPSFDRNGFFEANPQRGGSGSVTGSIQTVPPMPASGKTRPVIVTFGLGGSHFDHSWNHSGSITVLVNEFLDRLSSRVRPSALASISEIHFGMGGSDFQNSFND